MLGIWAVEKVVLSRFSSITTITNVLVNCDKISIHPYGFWPAYNLTRKVKPKKLETLKMLLGWSLINSIIRSMEIVWEEEVWIYESSLFHSMIVDGKNVTLMEGKFWK